MADETGALGALQIETIEWEEQDNARFTREFTSPTLVSIIGGPQGRRVLSVGCGVGADVETLVELGWDAYGIEPGYRVSGWERRTCRDRLMLTDGRSLPFGDASFDAVTSFGVIEHVGAVGDSVEVHPDVHDQRRAFAREVARVVRPGGAIIMSTPNRLFPADFFHHSSRLGFRLHSPREPFSVSYGDFRRLFIDEAGCRAIRHLSLRNAFVFRRSRRHLWGRLLVPPTRAMLSALGSPALLPLARSPLNPFLMVHITR